MKVAEDKRWRRTSPLAAIFYIGRIFKVIGQNAVQSLAPFVAFLFAYEGDLMTRIVLGGIAFAVVVILLSFLRYWFFRYRITDDSVLIREGIVKKTQLDIKFDRIQAINTTQNIVFRPFGLVTVQLDTAGSAKQEGYLPAVKLELAGMLKERLLEKQHAAVERSSDDEAQTADEPSKVILRLGNWDMVKIGLSSNRALIIVALLSPLFDKMSDQIENLIEESLLATLLQGAGFSVLGGVGLAMLVVLLIAGSLAIASIGGAFLRYHNFELLEERKSLRSIGGLLTRHEHSINLRKIQSLRAIQNPILKIFKRYRLRARQASSDKQGMEKQFLIPLAEGRQLHQLSHAVFGTELSPIDLDPQSENFQSIRRDYVRSRFFLFGLFPGLLVTIVYTLLLGPAALFFLVWLPIMFLWAWINYRRYGFAIAKNGMVLRQGFIGRQTTAFLYRKVQRVSVTQTVFQKRKKLATIRFYLASGSLRLPYVDLQMANDLRDYILYRVESSELAWH